MSNFACEHCGTAIYDSPAGYVTGCEHYPREGRMTDQYAELRAALNAGPTPGPWFHGAKNGEHKYCVYDKICWTDESGRHGETPNMVVHVSPDDGRYREARYIAAANPDVIRALLAERDALAQDAARYRWRTINSAPKDGTRLLLAKIIGHPEHPTAIWWVCSGAWSERWGNWNDGVEPSGLAGPTHWRPMPTPDEIEQPDAG